VTLDDWARVRDAHERRALRAAVAVSLAVHAGVLVGLLLTPGGEPTPLPAVVSVDLVAALPRPAPAAPPRAAPAAKAEKAPAPAPKAAAPRVAKKVLPREAPKAAARKQPKVVPAPPRPEPLDFDEALAKLRGEAGEPLREVAPPGPATPTREAAASGAGRMDPELARWQAAVQARIERTWVMPTELRERDLRTLLRVGVMADGRVISVDVVRSSGNAYFDDNAVRALRQVDVLPPPPEPGDHQILFAPSGVD